MKSKGQPTGEQTFDFALVVDGVAELTEEVEGALFEAGCDDATLSMRHGRLYVSFTRAARSLEQAILSALRDVRRAKVGAVVLRVDESDLVTPAEIARRIGRTRQLVFQYITGQRGPGGFPPPECYLGEGHPLWAWCAVSRWLVAGGVVPAEVARQAEVVSAVNAALTSAQHRRRTPKLAAAIAKVVGSAA